MCVPIATAPAASQQGRTEGTPPASKEALYFHIKQNWSMLLLVPPPAAERTVGEPGPLEAPIRPVPRPCCLWEEGPGGGGMPGGNARESWTEASRGPGHRGILQQDTLAPSTGLPPGRRGHRATGLVQEVSISQRPSGVMGSQRGAPCHLSPPDAGHSSSLERPQTEKVLRMESSMKPVIPLQGWVVTLAETTLNLWGCARSLPGTHLPGTLLSGERERVVPQGVYHNPSAPRGRAAHIRCPTSSCGLTNARMCTDGPEHMHAPHTQA